MIAELHVAPHPPGNAEADYAHIEAAIEVVQASGLHYRVGALGTTFEGDPDEVWSTLRAAHEACLVAGAERVITSVRLAEWTSDGPSMSDLTDGFGSR